MRKILACLLILSVLSFALPFSVAGAQKSGIWQYNKLEDGTIVITMCDAPGTTVVVPDQLDGRTVSGIGELAFWSCKNMTSISIPGSVTSIGDNPFAGCTTLETIIVSPDHPYLATIDGVLFSKPDKRLVCYPAALKAETYEIPQGIQVVAEDAFIDCESLISVSIPDSVMTIGNNPFIRCTNLSEIIVSPDHPYLETVNGVLFSKQDNRLVCCPAALSSITYEIPQGTQIIGDSAFYKCPYLMSVTVPDSVTEIRSNAFSFCQSLKSITIPDSVTNIGYSVFSCCDNLVVTVSRDSYAAQYCTDNNIQFTYPDINYDWLND